MSSARFPALLELQDSQERSPASGCESVRARCSRQSTTLEQEHQSVEVRSDGSSRREVRFGLCTADPAGHMRSTSSFRGGGWGHLLEVHAEAGAALVERRPHLRAVERRQESDVRRLRIPPPPPQRAVLVPSMARPGSPARGDDEGGGKREGSSAETGEGGSLPGVCKAATGDIVLIKTQSPPEEDYEGDPVVIFAEDTAAIRNLRRLCERGSNVRGNDFVPLRKTDSVAIRLDDVSPGGGGGRAGRPPAPSACSARRRAR